MPKVKISGKLELLRIKDQQNMRLLVPDQEVIRRHTEEVKHIVSEYGLITISQFGKLTAHSAWLLVQHSDHDVEFQQSYLTLMQQQPDEVLKEDLARLTDRVCINQERPQIYGTQFDPSTLPDSYAPFPIENPEEVNSRRAALGLETMEEYADTMRRKYTRSL